MSIHTNANTNQLPLYPPELNDPSHPLTMNLAGFLRELPRLLAEGHEGRHALVRGGEVVSLWDTFEDAYQAGALQYGWGNPFLAQPVDPKFLDFPWPQQVLPSKTG